MKLFFIKINKSQDGFTLVETLVAISIFTVSLLGIMSVLGSGISNTNYAKRKMVASYLGQEGIEYARNLRDKEVLYGNGNNNAEWNQFKSAFSACNGEGDNEACGFSSYELKKCQPNLNGCKLYISNGGYEHSGVDDSGFVRKIWMENVAGTSDEVKIFSKVEWTQGSGNYSVTFSENLFNWVE